MTKSPRLGESSADLMRNKPETRSVNLNGITVPFDRLRRLRPDKVDELAESMRVEGQITPITLRPHLGSGFILVAGRHRIEAASKLGWESIRAEIWEGIDAVEAELIAIDENLVRAELSPAEQALHYARRKELYEELHPETRRGAAPGAGRGKRKRSSQESQNESFVSATAKKVGKSRATVAREVARAANVVVLADVVGTSLDQKGELEALGKLSAADQQDLTEQAKAGAKVSARTVVKQRSREKRDKALAKETEAASERLGNKIYSVIYADPPWRFEPWSRESGMDRAAENHYQTMTVDEICALKIPAAEDSALFLWATPPMEKIAHRVMEAWGFEYRSQLIWDKEKAGTGYWARAQHEHLLIGVKGDVPGPAPGTQPSSVIRAAPTRHSEKPEIFAEIIVAMFPTLPKIELFARKAREGWATWGNEAPEKEAGDRSAKAMPTEAAP